MSGSRAGVGDTAPSRPTPERGRESRPLSVYLVGMAESWLIYGANGYTGRLLVEEAVKRGLRPVLAGRSLAKVEEVARPHGLEARAANLDDAAALRELVRGHALVLHAAGPFRFTSAPMVEACLAERASYLDITGEISVFASVFARDADARQAGVGLMPGVGFDVVPTDCLARYVAERVPGATDLELAFAGLGGVSTGTARSMLESAGEGGFVRRGGALQKWPIGRGAHQVRFSDRARWVVPIPWGDLETAYRTTRIPNITTCAAIGRQAARALRLSWPALWAGVPVTRLLLERDAIHDAAARWVERRFPGPSADERARGKSFIWARASGPGGWAEAWLETMEGYSLTAITGIRAVERVLRERPVGALTPALAFGSDFILEVPGTRRLDTLGPTDARKSA